MIIDVHCHLRGPVLDPALRLDFMVSFGASVSGRDPDHVRKRMEENWFDETGDLLVRDMDEAGIDRSVVILNDSGLFAGFRDAVSLEQRYAIVARAVERHRDRLILFGGIEPRRADAVQFIEEATRRWGMKGVKLWPPSGFAPNDKVCYRIYEKCVQLSLPVVIHTGMEIGPLYSVGTQPILVSDVAAHFPELTIVLAHAGMNSWEEAAYLAYHYPNVYLDVAYWQAKYLASPTWFYRQLRDLLSIAGRGKVFFGTDWPAMRAVRRVSHGAWLSLIRRLPENADVSGVTFTDEEVTLFLGEAAARVLKLA